MAKEYETKVLDIDAAEIEKILKKLKAKKEPERLMKRWVFRLENGGYLRLRTDGIKNTITYKHRTGANISDTEEIEAEIDNIDKIMEILSRLGITKFYYQENKRTVYRLGDIEFCIDTWPKIPTYLEIEAPSEKRVKDGLKMLGLSGKDVGNIPAAEVYTKYGIDLHSFKEIKFN